MASFSILGQPDRHYMAWRIAESLKVLRKQINDAYPKRDKSSDGGIGDAAHASRNSDHNPWVKDKHGVGVVTAIDIDEDLASDVHSIEHIVNAIRKSRDKRVKYIIYEKRITVPGSDLQKWKAYTGKNPHDKHAHISVNSDPKHYDSTKEWDLGLEKFDDLKDGKLLDVPTQLQSAARNEASTSGQKSASETALPAPSEAVADNSEGVNQTAAASNLEITPQGIKAETTDTATVQNVVIEKRPQTGFFQSIWKKITGLSIFNGGLDAVSNQAQQVQALGLTSDFWQKIVYLALGASVIYLAFEGYKHYSRIKEEKERDAILARENSSENNFVQFVNTEDLPLYKARGYKIITR